METGKMSPRARAEAAFVFDDSIVARPLAPAGVESVVLKNQELYLKWINYSFQGGVMYSSAKAKGFVNATPTDVDVPGVPFQDGAFKYADLILMKIGKNAALGALKVPVVRAINQAGKAFDGASHNKHLQEVLGEVRAPAEQKDKIKAFTPSDKEVEARLGR
jgi:hypothetical protein